MPVDLGKVTDIWSFYMDVEFFYGLGTFTFIKYVIKIGPHNALFLQCSEYKYRTFQPEIPRGRNNLEGGGVHERIICESTLG